jgi:hypothetical protein
MGLRNLATVLLRLYGLLLFFYCFQTGQQVLIYIGSPIPTETISRTLFISSIASIILYAITGACLLAFAKNISGWVVPKTSEGFNIIVSAADLGIVTFSLAGVVFFVSGVQWLVNDGIVWRLTQTPTGSTVPLDVRMKASMALSVVKLTAGVLLMFGSQGLVRAFRWARGEASPPNFVVPRILKCPNCGTVYNPEDYRQDVLQWLCPQCGKELPKE